MKTEDRNQLCYNASDKIITILEELGYITERKPSYSDELRDLVAIEIRRTVEIANSVMSEEVADIAF